MLTNVTSSAFIKDIKKSLKTIKIASGSAKENSKREDRKIRASLVGISKKRGRLQKRRGKTMRSNLNVPHTQGLIAGRSRGRGSGVERK